MSKRVTTMDHEEIKNWISKHNGKPVLIEEEKSEGPLTSLSVKFQDEKIPVEVKEELDWPRFFEIFEQKMLAFQYDEEDGEGKNKNFRIVGRNL